jgi:hypothetical protein
MNKRSEQQASFYHYHSTFDIKFLVFQVFVAILLLTSLALPMPTSSSFTFLAVYASNPTVRILIL